MAELNISRNANQKLPQEWIPKIMHMDGGKKHSEMANGRERAPFQDGESDPLLTLKVCDQPWS